MNQAGKFKIHRSSHVAWFLTLLIPASGCAVLTPSQVKEVNWYY
jgi:hypothetical protein